MAGNLNSRLTRLEKTMGLRRKGSIVDGIRSIVLLKFEYTLFPDREPKYDEDKDFANPEASRCDWPADVWDNFWVDEAMVEKCEAELNRYRKEGNDPSQLQDLRSKYQDFRASQYCGLRTND